MKSTNNQVLFDLIEPPYYRTTFIDVPMDPFSITLFGYLGEINRDLYGEYLDKFREEMEKSDGSLMKTLMGGVLWEVFLKKSKDPLKDLLEAVVEEHSDYYLVYYFLYDFFGLNVKIHDNPYNISFPYRAVELSNNIDAQREVYLFAHKDGKIYPISVQEIDGSIRFYSVLTGTE